MAEDGVTELLERGQRGELWVRAPNVMKGYWRNPQATRETKTEDGWLKTGDIAYVDHQGKFHVVDRLKVRPAVQFLREDRPEEWIRIDKPTGVDQGQRQSGGSSRVGSAVIGASGYCRHRGCGSSLVSISFVIWLFWLLA